MKKDDSMIDTKKNIKDRPHEDNIKQIWISHSRIVPKGWQERKRRRARYPPTKKPFSCNCFFAYAEQLSEYRHFCCMPKTELRIGENTYWYTWIPHIARYFIIKRS